MMLSSGWVCLSVLLTICIGHLSVCLSIVHLSICVSICLSVCLSVYLCVCVSICMFICLSACLSVYLCVCLSICGSVCPSIYLCVHLFVLFPSGLRNQIWHVTRMWKTPPTTTTTLQNEIFFQTHWSAFWIFTPNKVKFFTRKF